MAMQDSTSLTGSSPAKHSKSLRIPENQNETLEQSHFKYQDIFQHEYFLTPIAKQFNQSKLTQRRFQESPSPPNIQERASGILLLKRKDKINLERFQADHIDAGRTLIKVKGHLF